MTALQHKQNPFGLLEHSDSEDDDFVKTKPKKPTQSGSNTQNPKPAKPKVEGGENKLAQAPKVSNKANIPVQADVKEKTGGVKGKDKEPRKQKGVPAEPHPLDRHSGTGINDRKPKKGGAGKFGLGTIKDEIKEGEVAVEGGNESPEAETEKDTGITLEEYYKLKGGVSQEERQINEAKAKVTQQELLKEIGTAKPLQSRAQQKVDDDKVVNLKKKNQADHSVTINTEHADLLRFKTGFKTFTERKPELQGGGKPAPQIEKKPEEGGSPQIKVETLPTGTEGVEEIVEPVPAQDKPAGKGPRQYNNEGGPRKYNPNWKPRQGGDNRDNRDNRGEPRGEQRDRRGGDNKPPNFEDEKAFPKLG